MRGPSRPSAPPNTCAPAARAFPKSRRSARTTVDGLAAVDTGGNAGRRRKAAMRIRTIQRAIARCLLAAGRGEPTREIDDARSAVSTRPTHPSTTSPSPSQQLKQSHSCVALCTIKRAPRAHDDLSWLFHSGVPHARANARASSRSTPPTATAETTDRPDVGKRDTQELRRRTATGKERLDGRHCSKLHLSDNRCQISTTIRHSPAAERSPGEMLRTKSVDSTHPLSAAVSTLPSRSSRRVSAKRAESPSAERRPLQTRCVNQHQPGATSTDHPAQLGARAKRMHDQADRQGKRIHSERASGGGVVFRGPGDEATTTRVSRTRGEADEDGASGESGSKDAKMGAEGKREGKGV